MKLVKIALVSVSLAVLVILILLLFSGDKLSTAISRYEKGSYISSLKTLNRLAGTADYETGEKIQYYRCKAINGLADRLENKYREKLDTLTEGNDKDGDEARNYITKKLEKINAKTQGDLMLVVQGRKARIISGGKFYDQFTSRYKGSRYLEDLDLDELEKIEKTSPQKLLNAVAAFYRKYPQTLYVPRVVKMIFRQISEGIVQIRGREELIKSIVNDYARRYPTSSDVQRLFQCNGDNVNLRDSPGIEGSIVGKIARNELLLQLEKSMDTRQVGDIRDYWYRVSTMGGVRGWIFGKFLAPMKVEPVSGSEDDISWAQQYIFNEWEDSNTPKNWMHVSNGDKYAVSFSIDGERRIVKVNSTKGNRAGIFRRFNAGDSFVISTRGRFVAGDSLILFAVVMGGNRVYYLRLQNEEIELSGRTIPVHTSDWHEYRLIYHGRDNATLMLDGNIVLSRIPPVESNSFGERGLYLIFSRESEVSLGELEYVRIK